MKFLFQEIYKYWDELPGEVVHKSTVNAFKDGL